MEKPLLLMFHLLEILNHLKNKKDSIILTGGIVPTYDRENLLEQGLCQFVLTGESENKINFLLESRVSS